jgi:hypothetical protein
MIRRAITELKEKKGSSRAAILKYILQHYKVGSNFVQVGTFPYIIQYLTVQKILKYFTSFLSFPIKKLCKQYSRPRRFQKHYKSIP